jgi:hypothetical protein
VISDEIARHIMTIQRCPLIFLLFYLALLPATAPANAPPPNTLPIIVQRPNWDDIDIELFCLLSWMGFDGVHRGSYNSWEMAEHIVPPAMATGMYLSLAPGEISRWGEWSWGWTGRISEHAFGDDSAYAMPLWRNTVISDTVYTGPDILRDPGTALHTDSLLDSCATVIANSLSGDSCVWFYTGFNEAPAHQWWHMVFDSTDTDYYQIDDYIPNMFTQSRESLYRADLDTMLYLPTFEEVDPTGVLSWLKYRVEAEDPTRTLTNTFSIMHTITQWAGMSNYNSEQRQIPPTFADQAQAVRSFLSMEYQEYTSPPLPEPVTNAPDFFLLNCYPFRQVGLAYQDTASYTPALQGTQESWLIEHFEEGMDSTFITAWRFGLEEHQDVAILFNPQAFGRSGGEDMWTLDQGSLPDTVWLFTYGSYNYRVPTPQEYLMSCNGALLRQAKGFSPHCLMSYYENTGSEAGLLDSNNVSFDAPYEEWVYRDRLRSDFFVIPPDSYPPFIDSPYDFDPLFDLPTRPVLPQGDRATEVYLLWKFAPYARLWNSMQGTNAQIARVAPELAGLSWWDGYEDVGSIAYDDSPLPLYFAAPQMKLFGDSTESISYLFYVNRFCRADDNPFEIVIEGEDLPEGVEYGDRVLDHSRRFILEGTESPRGTFTFLDTLDAGQARLVQFFDPEEGLDADIRITKPDVWTIDPLTETATGRLQHTAGTTVEIVARFYNMGTEGAEDVEAVIWDITDEEVPDPDTVLLEFEGLSMQAGYCRTCDYEDAVFSWETDASDIGTHILEVRTIPITGEPDTTDNRARAVFLIKPADYATTMLEDPWDQTEAESLPPAWHTADIDTLVGWGLDSTLTDSVSGMFEGMVVDPSATNRVYFRVAGNEPIRPDVYHMLSLAGIALDRSLSVYVGWINVEDDRYVVDTGLDLGPGWTEAGAVDLNSLSARWEDADVEAFWLEFRGSSLSTLVRLGWVKLTNGGE